MRRPLQIWLFAVLLFAAALFLFTRENRFPFYYHPDEPGKVEQVQTADWNYNHPMLMLSTARAAAKVSGVLGQRHNSQQVVEIGRWISAAFCAGSAVLLAAMVWLTAGRFAGIAAGLLLLTNHQFFELAHYFKEDTALLFGVCAWFFALTLYWKRPHWTTAALVGVGASLAVSGKYLGVFAPLLSLWLVPHRSGPGKRALPLAAFAVALVSVFALVNLPMLLELANVEKSFQREVGFVVSGQRGLTRSVPHSVYLTALRVNVFFVLWIAIGWHYAVCWRRRRELTTLDWVVGLFPVAYLAALSFSPKTNDRYFLPATALFLCLVAYGTAEIRKYIAARNPDLKPAHRTLIGASLLLILVAAQVPYRGLLRYCQAFRGDDTAELVAWLNTNLPDARIAIDRKVMIATPKRKKFHPYQPLVAAQVVKDTVESFDGLEALQAQGITHLVLSESTYGRYKLKSHRPQAGEEAEYNQKSRFYTLLLEGKPLWMRDRNTVTYLHPGLEVYAVPPAKSVGGMEPVK